MRRAANFGAILSVETEEECLKRNHENGGAERLNVKEVEGSVRQAERDVGQCSGKVRLEWHERIHAALGAKMWAI